MERPLHKVKPLPYPHAPLVAFPIPAGTYSIYTNRTHSNPRFRSTKGKLSKVHRCKSCSYQGPSKDVTRHTLQVHRKPEPGGMIPQGWYECICSHNSSRKDDFYKRHLPKCKKDPVRDCYTCQCGQNFIPRDQFTEHVSTCGTKLRGRPPKRSITTGEELSG